MGGVVGGIVGSIVGGSSASHASDKAAQINADAQEQNREFAQHIYDLNRDLITPEVNNGNTSETSIMALLGLGGDQASADKAFQQFQDNSGYQFQLKQGLDATTANMAARGGYQSGAALKALQDRGNSIAQNSYGDYLAQLTNVANRGVAAKGDLMGQGNILTNNVTNANNSQAQSGMQNAYNQANITNQTIGNIQSSFNSIPGLGGGGGGLGSLLGLIGG